jgi:hypothetical protein
LELRTLIKIKSIWEDEDTAWCRFSMGVNMLPFSQWQSQHPAEFSWSMVSALRYLDGKYWLTWLPMALGTPPVGSL